MFQDSWESKMLASHDTKFRLTCIAVKHDRKEGEISEGKSEEISKKKKKKKPKKERVEEMEEEIEEKSEDESEDKKQEGIVLRLFYIFNTPFWAVLT